MCIGNNTQHSKIRHLPIGTMALSKVAGFGIRCVALVNFYIAYELNVGLALENATSHLLKMNDCMACNKKSLKTMERKEVCRWIIFEYYLFVELYSNDEAIFIILFWLQTMHWRDGNVSMQKFFIDQKIISTKFILHNRIENKKKIDQVHWHNLFNGITTTFSRIKMT